jgi:hypothetical protein
VTSSRAGLIVHRKRGGGDADTYLPNPHSPMAAMTREPVTRCIQGLLKGSGNRVLLCDPIRNGGPFSTNGISFERFSAAHCLMGQSVFSRGKRAAVLDHQDEGITASTDPPSGERLPASSASSSPRTPISGARSFGPPTSKRSRLICSRSKIPERP